MKQLNEENIYILFEVYEMAEREEKEKIEVKQPEERAIAPWRPSDILQAFNGLDSLA